MKKGVNLIGYVNAEMGLGESIRSSAKALSTTDIEFGMIDFPLGNPSRMKDYSWNKKKISQPVYNTNIFHINPPQMNLIEKRLGSTISEKKFNIGVWHWELPELPDEWQNHFKRFQEIWVPSNFIKDAVSRKSPIPVIKIPHCIHLAIPHNVNRRLFNLPDQKFLFLSLYDTRSVQQRKNPEAVVDAFLSAFAREQSNVGLVIKVNNHGYKPHLVKELKNKIQGRNDIYLLEQTLNREMVNALIHLSDCLISLHRSEGFGLTLAEGMYLGKPVIGTDWSGNVDFMNDQNSCPVNYELVKVGKDYDVYKSDQTWAEPDIDHAAFYMKKLVENPMWSRTIALKGQQTIQLEFSPQRIGEVTKERLRVLDLL